MPMLSASGPALIYSDALRLSNDRNEACGIPQVTDTYLVRGATYTLHSGMIVAVLR